VRPQKGGKRCSSTYHLSCAEWMRTVTAQDSGNWHAQGVIEAGLCEALLGAAMEHTCPRGAPAPTTALIRR